MEIELRLGLVNFGAEVTTTTVLSRLLFKSDVVGLKKQSLAIFSHKPAEECNQHRIDGRGSDRIFLHNKC